MLTNSSSPQTWTSTQSFISPYWTMFIKTPYQARSFLPQNQSLWKGNQNMK
jgi:hypothetical protein